LPRDLNFADESVHLYQAKRILQGEVIYRDFWNVITPGWMYLMAVLFGVFGTDLAIARIVAAVLHGLTAVFLFLACRRLGIRTSLSWPPALAYVVLCPPAWSIASQHWLATTISATLLFVLAGRRRDRAAWPFFPGLVTGLLIAVTQQRGLILAAGLFIWLIVDDLIQRRFSQPLRGSALLPQLALLVAGGFAVGLPLSIWMVAGAGFDPMWQSLVVMAHAAYNYSAKASCEWGYSGILTVHQASMTFPLVLKYLPSILIVSVPRLLLLWLHRNRSDEASRLTLLICFCASSVFSIWYFPDFIHIAFIAPVFFVTIAESLEWAAKRFALVSRKTLRGLGWAGSAAILVASTQHLADNAERSRARSRFGRSTAFGWVDLTHENQARLYDRLEVLMRSAPSRSLYCYPPVSGLYLMLDADDPTPYGVLVPSFNPPESVRDALQHLEANPPHYVAFLGRWLPVRPDDPIAAWIRRHYEPIEREQPIDEMILRRKKELGKGHAHGA
jgi:hypothetical protein